MKSAKMRTAGAAAGKKGWGMFGGGGHHGAKEEAGEPLEDHSEIEVLVFFGFHTYKSFFGEG